MYRSVYISGRRSSFAISIATSPQGLFGKGVTTLVLILLGDPSLIACSGSGSASRSWEFLPTATVSSLLMPLSAALEADSREPHLTDRGSGLGTVAAAGSAAAAGTLVTDRASTLSK